MTVYELRSVINGKPKKIQATNEMVSCFEEFKKLMSKHTNEGISDFEFFHAGYILANPIVREQLMKERKAQERQENKIDNRIQNVLWK